MRVSSYRERTRNEHICIDLQDESNEATQYLFDCLPYSLFTTFMLILGEMKYPHTVFKYQPLPYPGISYVVYVIFCVCMPIIIKNLLVSTKALRRVLLFKRCIQLVKCFKKSLLYSGFLRVKQLEVLPLPFNGMLVHWCCFHWYDGLS